jgi:hypothetical protein
MCDNSTYSLREVVEKVLWSTGQKMAWAPGKESDLSCDMIG